MAAIRESFAELLRLPPKTVDIPVDKLGNPVARPGMARLCAGWWKNRQRSRRCAQSPGMTVWISLGALAGGRVPPVL
ncbi:hypothetical protein PSEWESI4_00855 [Pseudomonas carbonaria]|uniref:Uncharacterized protein n=1 Tax=Zestomonas carbonaria TaxID=2762745 RepID=A0A7U7EKG3_9GAMM|nr:hypothetical protein PSEWESI4_00855 [Pseudomonas carbonaria]